MFDGFQLDRVDVGDVTLRVRYGGSGEPVVLLHGHPRTQMGEGNHADAWAAFRDPAVVHGMCEDYRAGPRTDRAHEETDRAASRKVTCPVLLLVSSDDDLDILQFLG